MKIIPLSEGAFTVDQSKQFVPFNLTNDDLQQRPAGSLLVEIQPFVVVTSKDVLLIDAGLGFSNTDNTLQSHQNLINNDIDPSNITKVLMSHLHKDHAGGVSLNDTVLNQRFLTFPNATYYIQQEELSFALQKGLPSYIPGEIEILQHANNVHFLQGDGIIDGYIR